MNIWAAQEGTVSSEDSFIDEVTEEVRRERLYGYARRYGWIAVLIVVALVGGAAWNEFRKAAQRSAAQERGDAVLSALEATDPAMRVEALTSAGAEVDGPTAAVIAMLAAGQAEEETGGRAEVLDNLDTLAADPELAPLYRDLAVLKSVLLRGAELAPEDRIARLEPLTAPGAPYRPLALEATAHAHVAAGATEAALEILQEILADSQTTQGLRQRASQLIVALGGSLDTG